MKLRVGLLALSLGALLSGCTVTGMDPQALMKPPRPTGEKAEIHALLEQKAGPDFTLRYPGAGAYRSAILMHNVLGDQTEEAIAFFQPKDSANNAITGTNVLFLTKKDNQWEEAGSFRNAAAQVDRISFGDLDGDGLDEAIVGWGNSAATLSSLTVYSGKTGQMMEQKLDQTYNELSVQDFDGDGQSELLAVSLPLDAKQPCTATLFRLKDGAMQVMGSTSLDTGLVSFSNVISGKVSAGQTGVVLDGTTSTNSLVTEILYWDQTIQQLRAPLYDPQSQKNSAQRSVAVLSRDVDGDGLPEVPFVSLAPGYGGAPSDDVGNLITWQRLDSSKVSFRIVAITVQNAADGYSFTLPESWYGRVTTAWDAEEQSLTFYEWNSEQNARGAALMTVRSFQKADWEAERGTAGFLKYREDGDSVLAVSCPEGGALAIPAEQALQNLQLLTKDA